MRPSRAVRGERLGWKVRSLNSNALLIHVRCPTRTEAPHMQFYTWFLYLLGVPVVTGQITFYLRCTHTAVFQSNSEFHSVIIRLPLSGSGHPRNQPCCRPLSTVPHKGRVSQNLRGAGVLALSRQSRGTFYPSWAAFKVLGNKFMTFRVGAVLLAVSWGPLGTHTPP